MIELYKDKSLNLQMFEFIDIPSVNFCYTAFLNWIVS